MRGPPSFPRRRESRRSQRATISWVPACAGTTGAFKPYTFITATARTFRYACTASGPPSEP